MSSGLLTVTQLISSTADIETPAYLIPKIALRKSTLFSNNLHTINHTHWKSIVQYVLTYEYIYETNTMTTI